MLLINATVVNFAQPFYPVLAQNIRHLDENHGLILVCQCLLGDFELQVEIFVIEIAEENVHGLFLPRRPEPASTESKNFR